MGTRLYRSRDDRVIAGVAGGVAEYFDIDPSLVRIVWALLFFAGGFGLLLYIIMAIVVPEEPAFGPEGLGSAPSSGAAAGFAAGTTPAADPAAAGGAPVDWRAQRAAERHARRELRRERRDDGGRTASLVIGGLLVLFGIGFLARELFPVITFDYFWPLILVGIGVVVLATAFRADDRGAQPPPPPPLPPAAPPPGPGDSQAAGPGAGS